MADAGPPLGLIAVGLVLWLAVQATIAGISIQTIGLILFLVGVVWLVIELAQAPAGSTIDAPAGDAGASTGPAPQGFSRRRARAPPARRARPSCRAAG